MYTLYSGGGPSPSRSGGLGLSHRHPLPRTVLPGRMGTGPSSPGPRLWGWSEDEGVEDNLYHGGQPVWVDLWCLERVRFVGGPTVGPSLLISPESWVSLPRSNYRSKDRTHGLPTSQGTSTPVSSSSKRPPTLMVTPDKVHLTRWTKCVSGR